jgi:phosphoribosylformylglycinamidine cyclo-ligase
VSESSANYRAAGVDYQVLDGGKRLAISKALATSGLLGRRGGRALDDSRGEPAFVFELGDQTLAFVLEGLGTKSIIARQVHEELGLNLFADVAYDTVAAILNDLCCVGALPLVVNAYFATGASEWYGDAKRAEALVEGWERACSDAGCVWGGGESPSLSGLVDERDIELAGAAVGVIPASHRPLLGEDLSAGDEIVLVASNGLHANGASLARLVAKGLDEGYATSLSEGVSLGEALLRPSLMYAPLVAGLLERGLPVTYLSHITGHGLLKLMRPQRELTYRIAQLPPVPDVLRFLVGETGLDTHSAYSTFNMGCGFAVYCGHGSGEEVARLAASLGLNAIVAGAVEEGPKQVILEPVGVTYGGEELKLSAETLADPKPEA